MKRVARPARRQTAKSVAALIAIVTCGHLPSDAPAQATLRNGRVFTLAGQSMCPWPGTPVRRLPGGHGIASLTQLAYPAGIEPLPDGGFLLAETFRNRIIRVGSNGRLAVVAGTGQAGYSGDGRTARAARVDHPQAVARMENGTIVIADTGNARIRAISPSGVIQTIAGVGVRGHSGDGGAATRARLSSPSKLTAQPDGGILLADTGIVRRIGPDGTIHTVAGGGSRSSGRVATDLRLPSSISIAGLADSSFLVTDGGRGRILRVAADGHAAVAAGGGSVGGLVDGIAATKARLGAPSVVASLPGGAFLFGDERYGVIRQVSAAGIVNTIAGDPRGTRNTDRGDGGPPRRAVFGAVPAGELEFSFSQLAATSEGGVLVAEAPCGTVRYLAPAQTRVLALAIPRSPAASATHITLAAITSRDASVTLHVRREGKKIGIVRRAATGGARTVLHMRRKLRPGAYALTVNALGPRGEIASKRINIRVPR